MTNVFSLARFSRRVFNGGGENELPTVQIIERHSFADNSKVNDGDNVSE